MGLHEGLVRRAQKMEDSEGGEDMSRRTFLALETGLAGTLVATSLLAPVMVMRPKGEEEQTLSFFEKKKPEVPPDWFKDVIYDTPYELQGKKLSSLEVTYVKPLETYSLEGVPLGEKLPPIDFASNLSTMFEAKKGILETANPTDSGTQLSTYAELENAYTQKWTEKGVRQMDLQQFRTLIEGECLRSASAIGDSLERITTLYIEPILEKNPRLTAEQKLTLKDAFSRYLGTLSTYITPDIMLAYLATELMPVPDRSAAMLEFITEHAGVEYLESIPSLGDSLLSFGPFQLTSFVVGDQREGGEAGSVTQLLTVMRKSDFLPKNLSEFTSIEQHIRAGYLFAFHNLITLVQDALKREAFKEFSVITDSANAGTQNGASTTFLEYLAAAHHKPAEARKAMRSWLESDDSSRSTSLSAHFGTTESGAGVRTYAEKANACFVAVQNKLHGIIPEPTPAPEAV